MENMLPSINAEFIPYFFDETTWAPNKFLDLSLRLFWTLRVGAN